MHAQQSSDWNMQDEWQSEMQCHDSISVQISICLAAKYLLGQIEIHVTVTLIQFNAIVFLWRIVPSEIGVSV